LLDHDHFTGEFLGIAHQGCNLRRRRQNKLKIFCHNASYYDMHFIVQVLAKFGERLEKINILPFNSENFRSLSFNCFQILDSLSFLQSSLSGLAEDLSHANHTYPILRQSTICRTNKVFDQEKFELLLKKNFFPYEFATSIKKLRETTKLPSRKHFYSNLSEKGISEKDHKFAEHCWQKFGIRNLMEYAELYCRCDTILLAEIFQKFRLEMYQFSGIDCTYYASLPGFSW